MQFKLPQELAIWMLVFILITDLYWQASGGGVIGVDYGLNGNNLPSPKRTVSLLRSKGITRVRMYDARQEITGAFANSGIDLMIGISNELVPKIAGSLIEAINWVTQNVAQFPNSGISAVIVGNEWLLDSSRDPTLLLPAMLNIYTALTTSQTGLNLDLLKGIKVSTSHALNVLGVSFPPSSAVFNGSLLSILSPLLEFLEQTGSFFMVNVLPYFAYLEDPNVSLDFALFQATKAVQDPKTKLNYTNLFDLQLDAVYAALDAQMISSSLGFLYHDDQKEYAEAAAASYDGSMVARPNRLGGRRSRSRPQVVVGESGWPSGSGPSSSVPHAAPTTTSNRLQQAAGSSLFRHPRDVSCINGSAPANSGTAPSCSTGPQLFQDKRTAAILNSELSHRRRRSRTPSTSAADPDHHLLRSTPVASDVQLASSKTCSGRVCTAATRDNARIYNQNLIRHVLRSPGTPANPTTSISAYIFELFDENMKPAGTEQHYGLFFPNGSPVYPITFGF